MQALIPCQRTVCTSLHKLARVAASAGPAGGTASLAGCGPPSEACSPLACSQRVGPLPPETAWPRSGSHLEGGGPASPATSSRAGRAAAAQSSSAAGCAQCCRRGKSSMQNKRGHWQSLRPPVQASERGQGSAIVASRPAAPGLLGRRGSVGGRIMEQHGGQGLAGGRDGLPAMTDC